MEISFGGWERYIGTKHKTPMRLAESRGTEVGVFDVKFDKKDRYKRGGIPIEFVDNKRREVVWAVRVEENEPYYAAYRDGSILLYRLVTTGPDVDHLTTERDELPKNKSLAGYGVRFFAFMRA